MEGGKFNFKNGFDKFKNFMSSRKTFKKDLTEDVHMEDQSGPQRQYEDWELLDKDGAQNKALQSIEFKEKGPHYEYLWLFFYEAFYINDIEGNINRIREYFYKLFTFSYKKTRSELDMLTELYKLLDPNQKK